MSKIKKQWYEENPELLVAERNAMNSKDVLVHCTR